MDLEIEDDERETHTFFFSLVGQYAVGKTSLIQKFKKSHFIKTYTPTETPKTSKSKLKHKTVTTLEDSIIQISICDYPGCTANTIDEQFMRKKSHIIILMYTCDDPDSFEAVLQFLAIPDLFEGRIVMVIRSKVDNKTVIESYANEEQSEEEKIMQFGVGYDGDNSNNEEKNNNHDILFYPHFSSKSKSKSSPETIEAIFVDGINAYINAYGDKPPKGGVKKKKKSSVVNEEYTNSATTTTNKNKNKKRKKSGGGSGGAAGTKKKSKQNRAKSKSKDSRTNSSAKKKKKSGSGSGAGRTNTAGQHKQNNNGENQENGCSCVVL